MASAARPVSCLVPLSQDARVVRGRMKMGASVTGSSQWEIETLRADSGILVGADGGRSHQTTMSGFNQTCSVHIKDAPLKCTPRSFQFGTVDADSAAGRIKLQCADSPERTQSTLNKRAWEKPTACLLINQLSESEKCIYNAADVADFPCWPLAAVAT